MASVPGLLLLVLISSTQARQEGATTTSCYNHFINHTLFMRMLDPALCTTNIRCSDLTLTPSCPAMQDDICCRDFDRRILYTNCNYTFQWSDGTNLGFLVQARINPDPSNTVLNPASTIVGRWDTGDDHQTLRCKDSMNSNGEPVPNSVTHTRIHQETNQDAPTSINVTWWSDTTNPEGNGYSPVNITFFYTIARDISTIFLPYTLPELSFELRSSVLPPTEVSSQPPSSVPPPTGASSQPSSTTENAVCGSLPFAIILLITAIFAMN